MPTLFTRVMNGEVPGRFVWQDERAVAFLSINPMGPGHALVVPREEVDHWVDAADELLAHLTWVSHRVAAAQQAVFDPPRIGLVIAGFEVPHLHVHVYPVHDLDGFDFRNAERDPDPAALDAAAARLREALRAAGHGEHVPADASTD